MRVFLSRILLASLVAGAPQFARVGAQSAPTPSPSTPASDDESRERPPAFATGIGVGAMHFRGGRSEFAVSATLQYSPSSWLTFSAAPGFGRTSLAGVSKSGLTDVPLSAGAAYGFGKLPWSPTIFGSVYSTVSASDTVRALGVGRTVFGAATAMSGWATDRLNLTVGASHPLSAQGGNGSVDLEAAYALGRTTPSLGFTSEVGRADSGATLAQSMSGGVAVAIAGPLTLTIDGSHGLTPGAPSWTFAVGLGTAFAGVSPLNPSSPLRRLNKVLGSRLGSTSGYTKGGTSSGGCKKSGTC